MTKDGLRERDRLVIRTVRDAGVPLVVTLAGGYARRVEDTVAIHVATIEEAVATSAPKVSKTRRASCFQLSDDSMLRGVLDQINVSPYAVFRSMMSPRAAMALASAIVKISGRMSSSSSGLCGESGGGGRRSQAR